MELKVREVKYYKTIATAERIQHMRAHVKWVGAVAKIKTDTNSEAFVLSSNPFQRISCLFVQQKQFHI